MADQKLTALTENTTPALTDIVYMVDDPGGSPISKKITVANILSLLHPVGSIYTAVVSTNPGTLLGFGTWSAFGAGKVLVGLDGADGNFDIVEETGGTKTHTLATSEMPAHTHSINTRYPAAFGGQAANIGWVDSADVYGTQGVANSTGGGGAHNNLQPYIVVYMWKRTA